MPPQRSAREPGTPETGKAKMQEPKEEEQDDDYCLLPSVAIVLVQNGWIGAGEIGRLGLTSRDAKWGDGEIWTALCHRRWSNSADIPQGFVHALGGYRALYRHRSTLLQPAKNPRQSPLPPPRLKPNQFSILIDVVVAGESAFSHLLNGVELMNNLLKEGSASYKLKKPFILGSASCGMSGAENGERRCLFDLERDFKFDDLDARIHLLRSTDKTSCCILVTTEWGPWACVGAFDPIGDPKDGLIDWKNAEAAWVHLTPETPKALTFRQTATAAEIHNRLLKKLVFFSLSISVSVVEPGDKIGITGFKVSVVVGKDGYFGEHFNKEMSKISGVTMLHLLEQLQGVQFNPTMSLPDESWDNSDGATRSLEHDQGSDS